MVILDFPSFAVCEDVLSSRADEFLLNRVDGNGCGANSLALLSGIDPLEIDVSPFTDDPEMVKWLRDRKIACEPITLSDVSQSGDPEINEDHVILISQLMCQNECSWGVIHKGMWFHNFGKRKLRPLTFLNRPIRSAYIVFDRRWIDPSAKPARVRTRSIF